MPCALARCTSLPGRLHQGGQKLLEMPQTEEDWHERRALLLRALVKAE